MRPYCCYSDAIVDLALEYALHGLLGVVKVPVMFGHTLIVPENYCPAFRILESVKLLKRSLVIFPFCQRRHFRAILMSISHLENGTTFLDFFSFDSLWSSSRLNKVFNRKEMEMCGRLVEFLKLFFENGDKPVAFGELHPCLFHGSHVDSFRCDIHVIYFVVSIFDLYIQDGKDAFNGVNINLLVGKDILAIGFSLRAFLYSLRCAGPFPMLPGEVDILRQWKCTLEEDGKFVPANSWILDSCSLSRLPNQVCPDHYLEVSFSKSVIFSMSSNCPMNSCSFLHECGKIEEDLKFKFSTRKVPAVIS